MAQFLLALICLKIGISSVKKYYVNPKKVKTKLKQYSKTDMVEIVDIPEDIYHQEEVKPELQDFDLEVCKKFMKKLELVVPEKDLSNYYRNFSTLKRNVDEETKKKLFNMLLDGSIMGGSYKTTTNEINISANKLSDRIGAVTHELLHAASNYFDKNSQIIYCGFTQTNYGKINKKTGGMETFGVGLNEGYTQYLNNLLFPSEVFLKMLLSSNDNLELDFTDFKELIEVNDPVRNATYGPEQKMAKCIEAVVGEEEMRSLYFNGNLYGLVKKLDEFAVRNDTYQLINYSDVLCEMRAKIKVKIKEVTEAEKFIDTYLIKIYLKSRKELTTEELDKMVKFFASNLPYTKGIDVPKLIGDLILDEINRRQINEKDFLSEVLRVYEKEKNDKTAKVQIHALK